MRNQLQEKIALIKSNARRSGEEIIFNFTADGQLVIVANKGRGCIGLISIRKDGSLRAFDVNMHKWKWAEDEGFSVDEMASDNNIKDEIFKSIDINKLIKKIAG